MYNILKSSGSLKQEVKCKIIDFLIISYTVDYQELGKISEVLKRDFDEDCSIDMPSGTIEKIIGRKLTWDDEPVEI